MEGPNRELDWFVTDDEFGQYVAEMGKAMDTILFGRVTYQMMESFWPTPAASKQFPDVAKGMNANQKIVFSRTLERATWSNTRLVRGDAVAAMRELKAEAGPEMVILGSGSLVAQFTQARLIDELKLLVLPVVLGTGRTLAPFHAYIKRLSFQLDAHEEAVIDQKPVSGKPARFEKIRESPTRQVSPGIVAVLPGSDSGTRIIVIMAGFNTSSLVAYLTSEDGLRELEKARKANGGGPFFEAVILSELNGTTPLKSWLAELKPYDPKG